MTRARAEQVAALPWRKRRGILQILLVTSRQTGRWVIPKGWQMVHLVDFNAAKREAYEEAGVDGRVQRKVIGRYTYIKAGPGGAKLTCRVTVYPLSVTREYRTWPECRERVRQWFDAEQAAMKVREPKLRAILRAFARA